MLETNRMRSQTGKINYKKITLTCFKLYKTEERWVRWNVLCIQNSNLLYISSEIRRCTLEPGEETLPLQLQMICLLDSSSWKINFPLKKRQNLALSIYESTRLNVHVCTNACVINTYINKTTPEKRCFHFAQEQLAETLEAKYIPQTWIAIHFSRETSFVRVTKTQMTRKTWSIQPKSYGHMVWGCWNFYGLDWFMGSP